MNAEQLQEGARLLAAAELDTDPGFSTADACWYTWLHDHAAELIADAGRYQWLRQPDRMQTITGHV